MDETAKYNDLYMLVNNNQKAMSYFNSLSEEIKTQLETRAKSLNSYSGLKYEVETMVAPDSGSFIWYFLYTSFLIGMQSMPFIFIVLDKDIRLIYHLYIGKY